MIIDDLPHILDVVAADLIAESGLPVMLVIELDERFPSEHEPIHVLDDRHVQIL